MPIVPYSLFVLKIIVWYPSFFIYELWEKDLFYFSAVLFKRLCIETKPIPNKLHRGSKEVHPRLAVNMPSGHCQPRKIIHPWVKWSSLSLYAIMPFKYITILMAHLSFHEPVVPFFYFWPILFKFFFMKQIVSCKPT